MVKLKISRISRILESTVPKIPEPKEDLEQYTTPAELALRVSQRALSETKNGIIADLGAGTCRIAIATLLLGASKVIAVDIDERFPKICINSAKKLGLSGRLLYIISHINKNLGLLNNVEVIVTNPPFGVKRKGADREFLEYAMSLDVPLIIAIVKSGNFEFHEKLALKRGYKATILWSERFPLPASMPRHRSRIRRVLVDVIEFRRLGLSR